VNREQALQATATPVAAADGSALPFWQVGYGYVDLDAATNLVAGRRWAKALPKAQSAADARVLGADGFGITRSDFWTYDAPRLTVGGTDSRTVAVAVPEGTTHLKVRLSHPSGAVLGINGPFWYTVTVRDAGDRLLGTTSETLTQGGGTARVLIDLTSFANPPMTYGAFTFEVRGELAISDPDTLDGESLLAGWSRSRWPSSSSTESTGCRHGTELLEDRQVVEHTPVFDDAAVGDAEHMLFAPLDRLAGRRDAGREGSTGVMAACGDPDSDEVPLGDGLVDDRGDVRNGRSYGLDDADQLWPAAFRVAGKAVVDVAVVDDLLGRGNVAVGHQPFVQAANEFLVGVEMLGHGWNLRSELAGWTEE
jgi:hypothetical protein